MKIGVNKVLFDKVAGDLLFFQIGQQGSDGFCGNAVVVDHLAVYEAILAVHRDIAIKGKIEHLAQIGCGFRRAAGRNK